MRTDLLLNTASLFVISLACAAWAPAASAQTSAARTSADETVLEDVVVTANRREQSTFQVPAAVTAISGESLNERGLTQIENFASQVPGFSIQTVGTSGVRLILRGQNTGGAGASVATMADDVVLNSSSSTFSSSLLTSNIDTYDMERIEVLRGPQGTLYGATAQGGLLKYVTRKPKLDRFESAVEAGVSQVHDGGTGWSTKGAVSIPIVEGVAAIRITGFYNDVAGFVDNPLLNQKDTNNGKHYGGRVMLLAKPTDDLSILLTAFKQKAKYNGYGQAEVVGAPAKPNAAAANAFDPLTLSGVDGLFSRDRTPGNLRNSTEYYNGVVNYTFNDLELTSSTSYVKYANFQSRDMTDIVSGTPGVSFGTQVGPSFGLPAIIITSRQDQNYKKFNQELRLASKAGASLAGLNLDWQLGAFYSDEDITFNQYYDARNPADLSQVLRVLATVPRIGGAPFGGSSLPAKFKELSGFGEVTLKFTDRFELSVGGRYTHNQQSSQVRNGAGLINGTTVDILNPQVKTEENKFTYSIAPRFEINDHISLYGRVASGYRPGGPVLAVAGAPADFPKQFRADNTVNYELGAKGRLDEGRLAFDIALYRIDWTDVQLTTRFTSTTSGQAFSVTGNGGEARSEGLEWNFLYQPLRGLTLGWNGAYTDARLTSDAVAFGGRSGQALPYVPKFSSALNVDYEYPLSDDAKLTLGATYAQTGVRYGGFSASSLVTNHPKLPDYSTVDLRAGASFGRYGAVLYVTNLTDERGITSYTNAGGYQAKAGLANFINPRTIGVRLTAAY